MRTSLLLATLLALPGFALATEINANLGQVRIAAPGISVTFGSRNDRGDYWDGADWRAPDYWKQHHGPRGEK